AVGLRGYGVAPPPAAVQPASIALDLYSGGTATRTITLSNPGGSDLDYLVSILAPGSTEEVSGAASAASAVMATARPIAHDALVKLKEKSVPMQIAMHGGDMID